MVDLRKKFMVKLPSEQQDADIKKMKNELKKHKNNIEKLEKKITSILDKNKLKKKSKI
jgi:predicted ribosome quality control (RQC) complex YloA/Tae2 family protein